MDTPIGIGAGRQKTLQAIDKKNELPDIDNPDRIEVVIGAVYEISLTGVRSPPRETVDYIQEIYSDLPDEAKLEYLHDDILLRRINVARHQFNDWMGKRRRMAEIASPIEAGRSRYPSKQAQKRSRLEREASDELEERISGIKSAANGAQQRALNAVGSSVSEQTEQRREQRRQELREHLEEGSIVTFRNPNRQVGRVVRVNHKSLRVRYPNPRAGTSFPISDESEPEESEDRIQLDSKFLEPLDVETIEEGRSAVDTLDDHH
ncbi:hypothetical protein [Halorhabdus sp. CUG00001]|uniref:hypothetical protein n=1 Tax=Halorhabdus sp. CUG00001 TaxID=2600297 RepID=UPI00131ECA36|nr:hypothetical protein [Halorhabdus sp. CUG00001]